jgi:hypothetical protein
MSDASEPNSTETDHRWIHFKEFNILEFLIEAMYTPPNIESYPYYVTEYKFGIVAGDRRGYVSPLTIFFQVIQSM